MKKCFSAKRLFLFPVILVFLLTHSACNSDDPTEEAPQTYNVSGTVSKSDGGAAANASVMLVKTSDNSDAGQSPTNAAGEYIVTGVSAGSYKIIATLNGYETGTIENVNIVTADITEKDLVLQKITVPTYSIGGVVTKPDGNAAAGASVQVKKASDNTNVGQAITTDVSGAYSIGEIPAGAYNIIITLDGYETGILAGVTVNNANLTAQNIILQTIVINTNAINIVYSDKDATIGNLPSDGSVTATKSGADVTIASSSAELVEFYVSGSTSGGSLKIQNNATAPNTLRITLNSAVIASASKLPPIQITKNEGITIVELKGNSILSDNSSNEENATLISKSGSLEFEGYGRLIINGAAKHAIASSKQNITVRGGDISVTAAASDGFHAEVGFVQSGGSLNITASGDGIDAGSGTAVFTGGNIKITSAADDTKGIKADAGITVGGGSIEMTVSGAQSKGISSKADIAINSGDISIVTSGVTVLEAVGSGYDPSYCTAIKSDQNINITGGTIHIESRQTSDGGRGISADGDVVIRGGVLNITTAGAGKVYTAETGSPDSYTATCIKSNQNILLSGGNITCRSSGTGGKGVNADGTITIGNQGANNADLMLTVSTSGERFLVSGSSGGGQGGRPGGGGFGDNGTDYANPKAVKCEGNMVINSGSVYINCTQKTEGGEGLESKSTLTINGGNIDIHTYDDCINAATAIVINGGNIFCAASGQDAIDSNGPLTVNGGLTIANGVRGDGESFDAERNFQVNGGIIVGTQGGNAMTTPSGQQRSVRIQGAAGSAISIKNAAGETLLLFNIPVIAGATTGTTVTVTFSDPRLVSGSYTLLSGGSISGGTTMNGYNSGGTYSGGTSKGFSL
ncbi:MAG: carbohydrate-binding domain-containing protein [Dysgonamonadaceae bacterium]|nr:carbohydrate-binding domain-containing protein [Dysgonamonadaceae bacterium]